MTVTIRIQKQLQRQLNYNNNPNHCKHCSKIIEYSKRFNKFCNKSCSARWSNKFVVKRHGPPPVLAGNCKKCGTSIHNKYRYCRGCSPKKTPPSLFERLTIARVVYCESGVITSNHYSRIRHHSKNILKDIPRVCAKCGYSKHVELCHKKPISSFPVDTLISVVNSRDNLCLLCPNCHWELDHGL